MGLKIDTDNNQMLDGFSEKAVAELDRICSEYRKEIVEEAKRVERRGRDLNDKPEIIVTHVKEASMNYKKGTIRRKSKILVSIILDLLLLVVGLLFDKEKMLTDDNYLIIFAVIFIVATCLTVMKYIREV